MQKYIKALAIFFLLAWFFGSCALDPPSYEFSIQRFSDNIVLFCITAFLILPRILTSAFVKCSTCNEKISKNATFCPHCGEPGPVYPESDPGSPLTSFLSLYLWVLLIPIKLTAAFYILLFIFIVLSPVCGKH